MRGITAGRRLIKRIGRRGSVLLFLTLLDWLYGLSLARPDIGVRQSPSVRYIADIAPLCAWATLWLAVGVVCLVGAFSRRDQWAFAVAEALKVLWGVTLTLGWAFGGLDRGWVAGVIWMAFAGLVAVVASWPEAPGRRTP